MGDAATLVGLAGSVTTVAALALELPAYDADAIHGSRIPVDDVRAVTADLLAAPRSRRAAMPVMHPGRVDVIGAGCADPARADGRVRAGRGRRQRARHPRRHRAAPRPLSRPPRMASRRRRVPGHPHAGRRRPVRPEHPRPRHPRRPGVGLLRLPAPGGLARGGGPGQAGVVPGLGVLGPPGAGHGPGRCPDRRRRAGPGRARREPHRAGVHRRPQRRLDLRGSLAGGPGQPADLDPHRRRPGADRRAGGRRGAVRTPGERAHPRGARHLLTVAGPRARAAAAAAGDRRPRRIRLDGAVAGAGRRRVPGAPPASGLRARGGGGAGGDARPAHRARQLPREPAEHLHRQAHRADARRRAEPSYSLAAGDG